MEYIILSKDTAVPKPKFIHPNVVRLHQLRTEARKHLGQIAIYFCQKSRYTSSELVVIKEVYEHFVQVEYLYYNCCGEIEGTLEKSVLYSSMLSGDELLYYLNDYGI